MKRNRFASKSAWVVASDLGQMFNRDQSIHQREHSYIGILQHLWYPAVGLSRPSPPIHPVFLYGEGP